MKLKYKTEDKDLTQSFYVRRENVPYLEGNWHYHEEYELIYIIQGEGIRIVGDNMSHFIHPQLALVGPWLPHLWKNEKESLYEHGVDIIVIKFNQLFQGQDIFSIPEFKKIADLLTKSKQGLLFGSEVINDIQHFVFELVESRNADRLIHLIQILKILSQTSDYTKLSSSTFISSSTEQGDDRLSRIINYISDNYMHEIGLKELSGQVGMTPSSLCRFFKNRTTKTIFGFINDFRIRKACRMLISKDLSVTEICFESGFNSLTTFIRVFKKQNKITPREYQKRYLKLHQ
jgi:AraC-like DNA-binding protein